MRKKDEFYMRIAQVIATASYAERNKVGALIEKDHNIIAFGYNGTPKGFDNKCENYLPGSQTLETKQEVLHAESNAIAKCAANGVSCKGATLYCTVAPCLDCAKLIIQAEIKQVVYLHDYRLQDGLELLFNAGIKYQKVIITDETPTSL